MLYVIRCFILFSLLALSLPSLAAVGYTGPRQPYKPAEKFTKEEKAFLQLIAAKAKMVVGKNLNTTQFQLDCVKNKDKCKEGEQILAAVKNAYSQYRSYYVMTEYDYFTSRIRSRDAAGLNRTFPMNAEYSNNGTMYVTQKDKSDLLKLKKDDMSFIESMKDKCKVSEDKLVEHYRRQLASLMTSVPVVLMIFTRDSIPSTEEVISGFEDLLEQMQSTFDNFNNISDSNLEGLWAYQALAQSLVDEDEQLKPLFESLKIKIEPQGFFEHLFDWVKNTFFTYNILFIGCAVAAIVTANPILAMGCSLISTMMAAYGMYKDHQMIGTRYAEWLSDVNDYNSIGAAKFQFYADGVLMGFSVFGLASIVKPLRAMPSYSMQFQYDLLKANLHPDTIRTNAAKYAKEWLKGESKGQLRGIVVGTVAANASLLLTNQDIERISLGTAQIISRYVSRGLFTYEDSARVLCDQ